jgi:mono/diheme cytochrome c family protein
MKVQRFALGSMLVFFLAAVAASQQKSVASKNNSNGNYDYTELSKAPNKFISKPNPLANDPQAATAGKVLFEEHCGECHGDDALGTKRAPSLRAPEVQNAPAGAIYWILSNGIVRKRMPVWSKLPEPQRWQLVSFIKSLGTDASGVPAPAHENN